MFYQTSQWQLMLRIFVILEIYHTVIGDCPSSWTTFQDSCYKLFSNKVTWMEASELCQVAQGSLAEITTKAENQFIYEYVSKQKVSVWRIWIGLSDILKQGEWTWAMSLQRPTYLAWAPGQPDNGPPNEKCAAIEKGNAQWHDDECHVKSAFICEKSQKYSMIMG